MTDTPIEVTRLVRARYRERSPSDRVVMASAMFESAKALAEAGIRADNPGLSQVELRVALFDRLYGRDVTPASRLAIIERIRAGR